MTARPVFWLIHSESGWLVRRYWHWTYSTMGIYPTREAAEREQNNLASLVYENSTNEV